MNPLAASGVRANNPTNAASQEMVTMNSSRIPPAASQPSGPACDRKPMRKATPNTRTVDATLRTRLAVT